MAAVVLYLHCRPGPFFAPSLLILRAVGINLVTSPMWCLMIGLADIVAWESWKNK